ncbi:hypothetical protein GmHk_08G023209 [Glycine max]|nr:hypothetical protein GmHk_08G023209 [Glycine max]
MQQRLLLSFLCINVNNGDICCNEAHKAQLGGASGADPQVRFTLSSLHFVRTWFMVQRTSGSVLREPVRMPTKALHITSRKSLCGEGLIMINKMLPFLHYITRLAPFTVSI